VAVGRGHRADRRASGVDGRRLLLLAAPFEIGCEAVGVLGQALERDPMFGFAVPRVACADGCSIASLSVFGLDGGEWPRRILADDTEWWRGRSPVRADQPSSCEFGPLDDRFQSLAAAQ
jgi:hypothetical protein